MYTLVKVWSTYMIRKQVPRSNGFFSGPFHVQGDHMSNLGSSHTYLHHFNLLKPKTFIYWFAVSETLSGVFFPGPSMFRESREYTGKSSYSCPQLFPLNGFLSLTSIYRLLISGTPSGGFFSGQHDAQGIT